MGVCSNKNICCVGDNLGARACHIIPELEPLDSEGRVGPLVIASDIMFGVCHTEEKWLIE